jgi:hypothetical protein
MEGSTGIAYPFFDADLDILYMVGKGDRAIRYYELVDGALNHYRNDHTT